MAGTLEDAALEGYAPSSDQIREYLERRRAVITASNHAAEIVVTDTKRPAEAWNEKRRGGTKRKGRPASL